MLGEVRSKSKCGKFVDNMPLFSLTNWAKSISERMHGVCKWFVMRVLWLNMAFQIAERRVSRESVDNSVKKRLRGGSILTGLFSKERTYWTQNRTQFDQSEQPARYSDGRLVRSTGVRFHQFRDAEVLLRHA